MTELTGREIVKRCIEFRDPPRIGLHFATLPTQGRVWPETDFGLVSYGPDPDFHPRRPGEDEWGVVRVSFDPSGYGVGEAKVNPLAEGWHLLDAYRFPDYANPARYGHLAGQVAALHAQGKYVYGDIPGLMMPPVDLRGMANWFADHLLDREQLCRLLDRLVAIRLTIIEQYARAGMDGVITWDDMGDNERALVRPALFREIYLPRYQKTTAALHERGMHFIHHCCGQVRQYMDYFLEGGCDVIQLDQPKLMGVDWLSQNYGGRICFWNSIDIQKAMPAGDLLAIEREAHQQVWRLGNYGGGFMVKAYEQPESVGIAPELFEAQYRAFKKYAAYPLIKYE
jgi:uroporphyrinogen decarboxylase